VLTRSIPTWLILGVLAVIVVVALLLSPTTPFLIDAITP
jgi:hypothetical protein